MAVEKEPGGSEGSSEHTSGNWGGAGFQHRQKYEGAALRRELAI